MSSPERKKPKKHIVAAAHNITASLEVPDWSQMDLIFRRIAGVIGSLIRWLGCRLLGGCAECQTGQVLGGAERKTV